MQSNGSLERKSSGYVKNVSGYLMSMTELTDLPDQISSAIKRTILLMLDFGREAYLDTVSMLLWSLWLWDLSRGNTAPAL